MKWTRENLEDQWGEQRVVRKFLWLPRCFKNECRWFEFTDIIEKVTIKYPPFNPFVDSKYYWEEIGFK